MVCKRGEDMQIENPIWPGGSISTVLNQAHRTGGSWKAMGAGEAKEGFPGKPFHPIHGRQGRPWRGKRFEGAAGLGSLELWV